MWMNTHDSPIVIVARTRSIDRRCSPPAADVPSKTTMARRLASAVATVRTRMTIAPSSWVAARRRIWCTSDRAIISHGEDHVEPDADVPADEAAHHRPPVGQGGERPTAAMPTTDDMNSRGRARMIRHTQGARPLFRLRVGIRIFSPRKRLARASPCTSLITSRPILPECQREVKSAPRPSPSAAPGSSVESPGQLCGPLQLRWAAGSPLSSSACRRRPWTGSSPGGSGWTSAVLPFEQKALLTAC